MEKPDEQLMQDYSQGDHNAIAMIYERYKLRILNYCIRVLGNRADAEDVTSDVFVKIFANQYTIDPKAKFSTWLYTVAHNTCITRIRKRKNLVSVWFTNKETESYDQWDVQDHKPISDETLHQKEMAILVKEAVAQLPTEQKEAIVLREYHKLSYEEIAKVLDCSLEKVKVLIFRGREQLKAKLASLIQEGGN